MSKSRIMIVDDDPALTRVLAHALEQTGRFEVRAENNPVNVLLAALAFQPDLVLLDVLMPHVDGGDVAAVLKAVPNFRDLRIIFLTAVVSKDVVTPKGKILGGYRFLPKPIDTDDLIASIDRELMRPAA